MTTFEARSSAPIFFLLSLHQRSGDGVVSYSLLPFRPLPLVSFLGSSDACAFVSATFPAACPMILIFGCGPDASALICGDSVTRGSSFAVLLPLPPGM
jgi:hypothetical protein